MTNISPRVVALYPGLKTYLSDFPTAEDVEHDVETLIQATRLQSVRRYQNQRFWFDESASASIADQAEPGLKLENVAAHSWQVADACLLLAPHFSDIDQARAVRLAILHDKLELFTGDYDPVGKQGTGEDSHAFNETKQRQKQEDELAALDYYLSGLRPAIRESQRYDLLDCIEVRSLEAKFVKAVDKIQALTFIYLKKRGHMSNEHLAFSVRYSLSAVEYFPGLRHHHAALLQRLLTSLADARGSRLEVVETELWNRLPTRE